MALDYTMRSTMKQNNWSVQERMTYNITCNPQPWKIALIGFTAVLSTSICGTVLKLGVLSHVLQDKSRVRHYNFTITIFFHL